MYPLTLEDKFFKLEHRKISCKLVYKNSIIEVDKNQCTFYQ